MFQNNIDSTDRNNSSNHLLSNQYQMPNPTSWTIKDLDWNFDGAQRINGSVTQFTATPSPPFPAQSSALPCKRKTTEATSSYRPTKQFISEKKMIEHMNSLHLSSKFTNHNISPDEFEEDAPYNVFMSPADLEEKLRNAQRITVCEQIRNLTKDDRILPKALVDRATTVVPTPMNALVLWQPPSQILKIYDKQEEKEKNPQEEPEVNANVMESEELNMDNNNCLTIDFNSIGAPSGMDLDF